jgi:hypothetical protein
MENHTRGRSPSAGFQNSQNISPRHTPSPAPHGAFGSANDLGQERTGASFDTSSFNDQLASGQQQTFDGAASFGSSSQSFPNLSQGGLYQDQTLPQGLTTGASFGQQGSNLFPDFGNPTASSGLNGFDPPLFSDAGSSNDFLGSGVFDPQLLGTQPSPQQSINPTSLVNPMTSHMQTPSPPHHLSPGMNHQSSGSPHGSPAMQQSGFQAPSPRHSRNTSLDPSSAAYPQQLQRNEWSGMGFNTHRRQPSDTRSDVSSSAHPSPYLGNHESFDHVDHHSPLLGAQQDPVMYNEVMGIGNFSISENTPSYISPAHSPAISPRLLPQQQHQLPSFTSSDDFGMTSSYAPPMNQYNNGLQGMNMFPNQEDTFPTLNQPTNMDYNSNGEALSPPEINIQLAPPSRQASFEPAKGDGPDGALSPPDRSKLYCYVATFAILTSASRS